MFVIQLWECCNRLLINHLSLNGKPIIDVLVNCTTVRVPLFKGDTHKFKSLRSSNYINYTEFNCVLSYDCHPFQTNVMYVLPYIKKGAEAVR